MLGARLLGFNVGERICINDFFWPMAARCAARDHKVFLLGGRPAVMQRALAAVRRQAPSLQIAGSRHGYFEKTGADNDAIVAEINDAAPNILLVGFGMPIQERWRSEEHTSELQSLMRISY